MFIERNATESWCTAPGPVRARPLSQTLRLAKHAAISAGVTRLADVSGVAPFGIPVFQAIRPRSRLLSVSQGKGLTPMAAMVSALLEAVEQDCAERLPAARIRSALHDLDPATIRLWRDGPRSPLGIALDLSQQRDWLRVANLTAGGCALLPWDLVSLDFSRPGPPDARRSTVGLATGNTHEEACLAAIAEVIEHDLQAEIASCSPAERRALELDLGSVDDPLLRALIAHIRGRGFAVRAWAMGQNAGVAAFRCVITDTDGRGTLHPPAGGTACHPDRSTALLRALLEAVQSRITLIAGARDDLKEEDYRDGRRLTVELILGALSFGPGSLPWSQVPHCNDRSPRRQLESLLKAAERRSQLPVLLHTHAPPVPGLFVVHAFAPGLADPARAGRMTAQAPTAPVAPALRTRARKPILFVGPTLPRHLIPSDCDVRPPACCGDLAALLDLCPPAVGLIDGCFEIAPTVWHKELLDLIAHGIPVIGGASLGALRAAELHAMGMAGTGAIFEAYRDRRINRDDAVMVLHAPAELGHRPLTVALVDMEAALMVAPLEPGERRQLQRIARRLDFRARTWDLCLELYRQRTGKAASLGAHELAGIGSVKERDALQLVASLRRLPSPRNNPRPPLTSFYRLMLERRIRSRSPDPVPTDAHALPA